MASWKELRGPARSIGTAIGRAVEAVGDRDRDAYDSAADELAASLPEYSGQVLGALVRTLLEEHHPDGLDSDDIQIVLGRCYRAAAQWLPLDRLDVTTLVAVLASALGIHEPGVTYEDVMGPPVASGDDWAGDPTGGHVVGGAGGAQPGRGSGGHPDRPPAGAPPSDEIVPSQVPTAAAYAWHAPLLIADLLATGRRRLDGYLDAAFTEIARAETMEMP
jgi:hypothetical protein